MPDVWAMHISVMLHRNPRNADHIDYTITKGWYTGKYTDRPKGRQRHSALLAEGTFVYPQPIHDVRVVLETLTATVSRAALPGLPATPGRERSGFENVPLPLGDLPSLPSTPPQEPTAT